MSLPIVVALLAFLVSLAGSAWLAQQGRVRAGFALLVAAPIAATLAGAGVLHMASMTAATSSGTTMTDTPAAAAPISAPTPTVATPPTSIQPSVEIDAWRRTAEQLRRDKHFAEARDLYARVVTAAPGDADAWADLADASAAAAGGDLNVGATAIDHALQIDSNHLKGLWLKASLELQEKHYGNAADLWQRLLSRLPPDSSDARVVAENLAETRRLAAQQGVSR